MILSILNWVLLMLTVIFQAVWISSLLKQDRTCHFNDCKRCIYDGWCPMQAQRRTRKEKEADRNENHQA